MEDKLFELLDIAARKFLTFFDRMSLAFQEEKSRMTPTALELCFIRPERP